MKKRWSYLAALAVAVYIGVATLPIEIQPMGWCGIIHAFCW